MVWSFSAGLDYYAILGLENPMENVQVHDLTCYCATFVNCTFLKLP